MTKEQQGLCAAAARHFGVTKAKLVKQLEEKIKEDGESPLIELVLPDGPALNIAASTSNIALGKMVLFKYFSKSELYSDIVRLLENKSTEAVMFYSGGALLVAYDAQEYDGLGGIFVRESYDTVGYVFEPIAHYLEARYPICKED